MAVLDKSVFKVLGCIQKKPGEPLERGLRHTTGHHWTPLDPLDGVGVPGVVVVVVMVRTLGGARGTGPGVPIPWFPPGFTVFIDPFMDPFMDPFLDPFLDTSKKCKMYFFKKMVEKVSKKCHFR